jgi:hypothetical protein
MSKKIYEEDNRQPYFNLSNYKKRVLLKSITLFAYNKPRNWGHKVVKKKKKQTRVGHIENNIRIAFTEAGIEKLTHQFLTPDT